MDNNGDGDFDDPVDNDGDGLYNGTDVDNDTDLYTAIPNGDGLYN